MTLELTYEKILPLKVQPEIGVDEATSVNMILGHVSRTEKTEKEIASRFLEETQTRKRNERR